jgi:hypothetical protein
MKKLTSFNSFYQTVFSFINPQLTAAFLTTHNLQQFFSQTHLNKTDSYNLILITNL